MTPTEAWEILSGNIKNDCGPDDESWPSDELREAQEVFHELYAPHLTAKALFPNLEQMWPPSQRTKG